MNQHYLIFSFRLAKNTKSVFSKTSKTEYYIQSVSKLIGTPTVYA